MVRLHKYAAGENNSEIILAIRYRVGEAEMSNYATFLYSTFNFDNLHVKDSTTLSPTLLDPLVISATNSMQIIQRYGYTFELFQSYNIADKRRNATFSLNTTTKYGTSYKLEITSPRAAGQLSVDSKGNYSVDLRLSHRSRR